MIKNGALVVISANWIKAWAVTFGMCWTLAGAVCFIHICINKTIRCELLDTPKMCCNLHFLAFGPVGWMAIVGCGVMFVLNKIKAWRRRKGE